MNKKISIIILSISSFVSAVDLQQYGVSITISDIINNEPGATLILPDKSAVAHQMPRHLMRIKITNHPFTISEVNNGKRFRKLQVYKSDEQTVAVPAVYTNDPTKRIMPLLTIPFGFKYRSIQEVLPGTTQPVAPINVIFYKPTNAVSVTVDEQGNPQVTMRRAGNWLALVQRSGTNEPFKSMQVANVISAQREELRPSMFKDTPKLPTGWAAQHQVLMDLLIENNQIDKVEVDRTNNKLIAIAKFNAKLTPDTTSDNKRNNNN